MKRILIPALIALGLTAAVACSGTVDDPTATTTTSASHSAPTAEKSTAPTMTKAQEQAVGTAKDYLAYKAFSRTGLIDQLKYEGYSKKDATFAVDHITVNWNKQAVKAAKDYLDYSHFSRSGLIEQLEFEGYTHSQAVYGADGAGL
jgi:hypothetical protein